MTRRAAGARVSEPPAPAVVNPDMIPDKIATPPTSQWLCRRMDGTVAKRGAAAHTVYSWSRQKGTVTRGSRNSWSM